jgi:hypothetical protein
LEELEMNFKINCIVYPALAGALTLASTVVHAQTGNTAFGTNALIAISTGDYDAAFGYNALRNNTTGSRNTANGAWSLYNTTSGSFNTGTGYSALYSNSTGADNSATGHNALYYNTTGNNNTATGSHALHSNSSGSNNTANGIQALINNSDGVGNTAVGAFALLNNTTADQNAAIGSWALYTNTTGEYNLALGSSALYSNTSGARNMALGSYALYRNTTGLNNVGVGEYAGYGNQTGSNNVFLGRAAGLFEIGSNKFYVASNTIRPLLYGEFSETAANNKLGIGQNTVPAGDAIAVWNGAHLTTGGVWTNASSRELKQDILPLSLADAAAALESLAPVRYVYRNSPDEEYLGFIAEEVPDLVASNDRKSLSPMDIVAVLTTVTKEQKAEIATLRDHLAKQDERMLQLELALAELQRHRSNSVQVSLAD